jgi:NAD(P)-dependent dehydrogenase (short-subunit alcohol dehydrogenase family)
MFFAGKRICLITGANSGIGKAAARAMARLGCTVIMVVRNRARGERVYREFLDTTGNKQIHMFAADLSSMKAIAELVQKIREQFIRIDILINNAGAFFSHRHLTEDGIEATFAVNYLSRFLLTNLLLDLIKKSPQGRIINVSADYHQMGKIDFFDLNKSVYYSSFSAFGQAKLADVLFTYSLAEKLSRSSITVNCMHPGVVATNIVYSNPDSRLTTRILYRLVSFFFRTPEKGAETLIYLASSPEVAKVSGRYFFDKKAIDSSSASYDKELGEKLWFESERLTSKYINKRLTMEWTE